MCFRGGSVVCIRTLSLVIGCSMFLMSIGCLGADLPNSITFGDSRDFGGCRWLGAVDLERPSERVIARACIEGVLYADSEWFAVVPKGFGATPWDVVVLLPRSSLQTQGRLRTLRGSRVVLLGDYEFELDCWYAKAVECVPARRPVAFLRGRMLLAGSSSR